MPASLSTKDPVDSLNDMYQRVMAPAAFLVLAAWSYLNYVAQTILTNSILSRLYPYPITQESLLEGPELVSLEVLVFVPTLIVFLVTYYIKPGKAWLVSKTISFTGVFFTLLNVGFTFAQEYASVDLESHFYWAMLLLLSILLSAILVSSCYRRYMSLTVDAHVRAVNNQHA